MIGITGLIHSIRCDDDRGAAEMMMTDDTKRNPNTKLNCSIHTCTLEYMNLVVA